MRRSTDQPSRLSCTKRCKEAHRGGVLLENPTDTKEEHIYLNEKVSSSSMSRLLAESKIAR